MRIIVTMSVVLASLSACGGADIEDDSSVSVYKARGTVQCAGDSLTLTELEGQLTAARIQVRAAACGTSSDSVYPALCGAPLTSIGIFKIPAAQASAAAAVGFAPLSKLPEAHEVSCG
jgi:hypothetical protein